MLRVGFGWLSERWPPRLQAFGAGALLAMTAETMIPEAFHNSPRFSGLLAAFGFEALLARRAVTARLAVVAIAALDLWWAGAGRPMNTGEPDSALPTTARQFEGSRNVVTRLRALTGTQTPPWRIDAIDSTQMWGNGAPLVGFYTAAGNEPLASARVLSTMLYGVTPHDPTTFAAIAVIVTSVAAAASYVPARRAMRVDPSSALRAD